MLGERATKKETRWRGPKELGGIEQVEWSDANDDQVGKGKRRVGEKN